MLNKILYSLSLFTFSLLITIYPRKTIQKIKKKKKYLRKKQRLSIQSSVDGELGKTLIATRIHFNKIRTKPNIIEISDFVRRGLGCATSVAIAFGMSSVQNTNDEIIKYNNNNNNNNNLFSNKIDLQMIMLKETLRYYEELKTLYNEFSKESLILLPIYPWGKFISALNILLKYAIYNNYKYISYQSFEIRINPNSFFDLKSYLTNDTLVVGALLPGHKIKNYTVPLIDSSYETNTIAIPVSYIDGCATPWNTLAIWDTDKLYKTGFLLISEGIPEYIEPGIEEVVTISNLQYIDIKSKKLQYIYDNENKITKENLNIFDENSNFKAKLVNLKSIKWNTNWKYDKKRKKKHEEKMKSKLKRAAEQVDFLNIKPGILHIVMDRSGK